MLIILLIIRRRKERIERIVINNNRRHWHVIFAASIAWLGKYTYVATTHALQQEISFEAANIVVVAPFDTYRCRL